MVTIWSVESKLFLLLKVKNLYLRIHVFLYIVRFIRMEIELLLHSCGLVYILSFAI